MRHLFAAELRKMMSGRMVWVLAAIGIGLGVLFSFGFANAAEETLAAGADTIEGQTAVVVRSWMAMTLPAAILGALLITREYHSGTIARSTLVSRTRGRLFGVKLVVALLGGLVYAAVSAGLAIITPGLVMPEAGHSPVWSTEATLTVVGIAGTVLLSAAWGCFLGWLIRNQTVTILAIVALTLMIEPGVQSILPHVAGFLFTVALTGVNLDGKVGLLSITGSYLVILGWLAVLGVGARTLQTHRDIS